MQFEPDRQIRPSTKPIGIRRGKRGRPSSGWWGVPFDRKAYQRQKAKERRDKAKKGQAE